jgi:hypothetical protein
MLRLQPVYEEFIAKAKRLFRDARKGEGGQNLPPCLEESSFINESDWAMLRTFDEILLISTSLCKYFRETDSRDIDRLELGKLLVP